MEKNGLIQKLVKDVLENSLEGTIEEHLRISKHQYLDNKDSKKVNYKNIYSKKNLRSSFKNINLNILRNRNGKFEPKVVKKYETVARN